MENKGPYLSIIGVALLFILLVVLVFFTNQLESDRKMDALHQKIDDLGSDVLSVKNDTRLTVFLSSFAYDYQDDSYADYRFGSRININKDDLYREVADKRARGDKEWVEGIIKKFFALDLEGIERGEEIVKYLSLDTDQQYILVINWMKRIPVERADFYLKNEK